MFRSRSSASRQKRPYFALIVFLVLFGFLLYIAVTSWNYQPPPGGNPPRPGHVVYLPVVEKGFCMSPPCPPAPTSAPYP